MIGCVDSGADRTLLPRSFAADLELDDSELVMDSGSSGGVGSTFNTWSSTVPIIGQVGAILDVGGSGNPAPWGPEFPMNPAFTDLDPEPSALLGRADFFQAFLVLFEEDGSTPSFTIQVR